MGVVFHIPLDLATTPEAGECLVNRWWSVHPEKGVAFWAQLTGYTRSEDPSPQCSSDEWAARQLAEKLYPDYDVMHLPVVFMYHAKREMLRRRRTANLGD